MCRTQKSRDRVPKSLESVCLVERQNNFNLRLSHPDLISGSKT